MSKLFDLRKNLSQSRKVLMILADRLMCAENESDREAILDEMTMVLRRMYKLKMKINRFESFEYLMNIFKKK